jgi:hypothetical protein
MKKEYPIIISQSIYQYDSNVFVWFTEAGMVGGASNFLSDAEQELSDYADSIFGATYDSD